MNGSFEQARQFFLDGVAHYEAGRLPEADRAFAAALSLVPGRPSTLTNLGATRLKLGRAEEALALLDEALAQEPDNVEALGHRATALAELGQHRAALEAFDRVLAAQPRLAHAWTLRGSVLKDLGRPAEAAASFREALARGGDEALNRYYLASVAGGEAPPAAPASYVQALFDGYAPGFERQLVEVLNYRIPERLAERLRALDRRFRLGLDLGCGTGLCAPLLKPFTERLEGVDLSAAMLAQAAQRGLYDRLVQAELVDYLRDAEPGIDLAVAADVFVYLGSLEAVFAGLSRRMAPGGIFCFSVELAAEDEPADFMLRPSLRYAHKESSLARLATAHGFALRERLATPVREDQRQPIPGLCLWLEKLG